MFNRCRVEFIRQIPDSINVGSNLFDLLSFAATRQQNLAGMVTGNTEPSVHQGEQFAAIAVNQFTLIAQ